MTRDLNGGRGRSIWLRPERSARGPVPEHSRAGIAAAAVALADAAGLGAVTMRSVAGAVGTAPASLYRYVATRGELIELMADQVRGEVVGGDSGSAGPLGDLMRLAREGRGMYARHPWLLDVPASGELPGPNAVAFLERALAALAGVDLTGPAKLETIGLFSGAVRLLAQAEADQRRAGQDTAAWEDSLAAYLLRISSDGRHPHLAEALAGPSAGPSAMSPEPPFDRAMTRIIAGLLPAGLLPPGPAGSGQMPVPGR